jgi:hypothetical protein
MKTRSRFILAVAAATLFHMNQVTAHPGHDHQVAPRLPNPPAQGHSHSAGEAHDSSHSHPHAPGVGEGEGHSHAEVRSVPEDLKELWGQINLRTEQLKAALEEGEHEKLHEIDEILSAQLRALPGRSAGLAANDLGRVQGQVNNLIRLLNRIHDQSDAGNLEAAQRQWQVFSRTIPLLARHYPEEISSYKADEAFHTHNGHGHSHSHAPGQSRGDANTDSSGSNRGERHPHSHD